MKLYLQFGYGMMEHAKLLTKKWSNETAVILSPRDLTDTQLTRLGQELIKEKAEVLLDPQMYAPGITNQPNLTHHTYWYKGSFPTGVSLDTCLSELTSLNQRVGATRIIIPAELAVQIDAKWIKQQKDTINAVKTNGVEGMSPIFTIALGPDVLKNNKATEDLLNEIEGWSIDSVYLILKHPEGDYLVNSATWLANALDIVSGMRLRGINVIVGYCNHQKLIMAAAGANAICSGTWLNVRAFCTNKFVTSDDIAQRSTWYYAPHLLSEFKVDTLDVAHKLKTLHSLATDVAYDSQYADALFTAPQPTLAQFTEREAFRHYLQCLQAQTETSIQSTYKATTDLLFTQLDVAEKGLDILNKLGINGQQRDFSSYISYSRTALKVLDSQRGSMLSRNWPSISK